MLDDGRVIYTRWDYNDRGQVFPQPLFQMNPDGTGQSEFYGNSSWFPTPIPPNTAGSTTSKLLTLLENDHHGVRLTRADYETIACWIDLYVPFSGDYTEANIWTAAELEKYQRYDTKRRQFDTMELDAVKRYVQGK